MKRTITTIFSSIILLIVVNMPLKAQTRTIKKGAKYDTIIVKHQTPSNKKPIAKPAPAPEAKIQQPVELVLPVPEYINQPYYYDKDGNKLIKLENVNALMISKKKTLGLKGAKQFLSMESTSSKVRFITKKDILFFIKTSGDVIDVTSYIKLYLFIPVEQNREVTINSKEGFLSDKEEARGKLINFSVKMISKDLYQLQFPELLEAGEYGFVWVKNMELKEFTVFAFGIDWKSSD